MMTSGGSSVLNRSRLRARDSGDTLRAMRYRIVFLTLAVLAIVSATVTVAAADTTETTVYGQATIAPYAIEVSGGGVSIDAALTYAGTYDSGPQAEELAHTITITNVGTSTCDLTIAGQIPPTNG